MQQPGQLDRRARLGQLGDDRRRQVLDVGDLDDLRLRRGLDPDRVRAAAPGRSAGRRSPARAGPCRCAAAARRGGRRPPGSELRRVEPASATVETLAPERRSSSSGLAPRNARLRRAAAEAEAGREELAQGAEQRRRVVGRRGRDDDLPRQHDLAQLARLDPLGRRGDRLLELARRAGAADLRSGRRGGDRASAAPPSRSPARRAGGAPSAVLGLGPGAATTFTRQEGSSSPLRQSESSGSVIAAGANEDQVGVRRRRRGRRQSRRSRRGPAPAGSPSAPLTDRRAAATLEALRGRRRAKRSGPREIDLVADRRAPRARSRRSGCSQQNQRSEASREAKTTAQGSATLGRAVDADQSPARRAARPARAPARGSASSALGARARASSSPAGALSRRRGRSRSRPCGPSRPGRGAGSSARRPRSSRPSRSPRSSSCAARRRRSWRGRSRRTA